MIDDQFEWDDAKAARNWRSHKVTFEMARHVFADPFVVEWIDRGHTDHEERFIAFGTVEGRVLFVCYALRAEKIRIISARRAEAKERRIYHDENKA